MQKPPLPPQQIAHAGHPDYFASPSNGAASPFPSR